MTRRSMVRAVVTLAMLLGALSACGADDDGAELGGDATSAPSAVGQAGDDDGRRDDGARAGSRGPGAELYVSLGDSYAMGFQPAGASQGVGERDGFADLVPDLAAAEGVELELVNLGCGGATVESMRVGAPCSEGGRAVDGPATDGSQLDAAVELLEAERGRVALVTVSIGGNDVTSCAGDPAPIDCVASAVGDIEASLAEMLPRLRDAAGPDVTIVGLTYPDVILGAWVAGDEGSRQLAQLSVIAFRDFINPTLADAYAAIDAEFVDVTEATDAYVPIEETTVLEPYGEVPVAVARVCELTWYCELADIHPRSEGYALIADLVVDTFLTATDAG